MRANAKVGAHKKPTNTIASARTLSDENLLLSMLQLLYVTALDLVIDCDCNN